MEKVFVGEELLWGFLGNLSVIAAFIGALFSAISYYYAQKENDLSWKKLARIGFNIHSIGVLGIIAVLFYLLFNHRFEYHYVWQHSNIAMPMQYILSCFWEGQEGSFLLWTFWNMVLGNILIRTSKNWEFSTMAIVALVQMFLSSMLLGIYIGEVHIGSSPFLLLREHPDFINLPFVQSATYLEKLDGRGLNPLLQNYWMT
ncbi:MAG: cytochrome C biogenesis protein, partial [Bacteroidota bacterium]